MPMSYPIQFIKLLAGSLLLIVFAMLSQRRILSLINLFAWQGLVLTVSTSPCQANRLISDRMRRCDSIAKTISSRIAASRLMNWMV